MSNVLEISSYHLIRVARRMGGRWRERFGEPLTASTRLADLSDATLMELNLQSREISGFLYDWLSGVLDLGQGGGFDSLSGADKLAVLDAQLFLVDQFRWECLGRLGLVHSYAGNDYPLLELVLDHRRIKAAYDPPFPQLMDTHPDYPEFQRRRDVDGEAMIRGMIPAALAAFGARRGGNR